jgi:aminoglycoside phosphotransferase (APT) family kinase protein
VRDRIDVALVRELVAGQFPQWASLPVREVEHDGWDNRTFRLGDELSVRLPTGDWYAQQVAKEQRWLPVLAPQLPLPIPSPVAAGTPTDAYPYPWSVYRWLPGEIATIAPIASTEEFASSLAQFLNALRRADAHGGPPPGEHNFFRGGPLRTYEAETLQAIAALDGAIDRPAVERVWSEAMASSWEGEPVWVHGDVAAGNLLVRDGDLAAVLDFGSSGVGDPACDCVIAWTFLRGAARARFEAELEADDATWARGRGWALWKALITRSFADLEQILGDA